jgi:hypothetical protein
MSSIIWPWLST